MKASILSASQGKSQTVSVEHADITQTFSKMCGSIARYIHARDMNSRIASEKLSRMWICGFILPLSQNIKKICDYDILTSWIALKKAGAWEDRMFDLLQLLREKVAPAV